MRPEGSKRRLGKHSNDSHSKLGHRRKIRSIGTVSVTSRTNLCSWRPSCSSTWTQGPMVTLYRCSSDTVDSLRSIMKFGSGAIRTRVDRFGNRTASGMRPTWIRVSSCKLKDLGGLGTFIHMTIKCPRSSEALDCSMIFLATRLSLGNNSMHSQK